MGRGLTHIEDIRIRVPKEVQEMLQTMQPAMDDLTQMVESEEKAAEEDQEFNNKLHRLPL